MGKGKAGSELRVDFIPSSFAETRPRKEFRVSKHVCPFAHTLREIYMNCTRFLYFGHMEVNGSTAPGPERLRYRLELERQS